MSSFTWSRGPRYPESFDDGIELLKAADRMRLEGVVSKLRDAPYCPGKQCDCDVAGGEQRTVALV
jgi:hypothetical protein